MREIRLSGSVEGVVSNHDPYSDPVFLGDVDPAQRLGPVLALFEPLMKLLDLPRGVLFVYLIGDAVHSCASLLS